MKLLNVIKSQKSHRKFLLQIGACSLLDVILADEESENQYKYLFNNLSFTEAINQSIEIAKHYVDEDIKIKYNINKSFDDLKDGICISDKTVIEYIYDLNFYKTADGKED